ncbi:MAG: hypothetical protein CFE43_00510 [Burkholderiales bacterium PBB3]|nr:MAG: hypothetical protein CFE43_00510 [Burkholderiales bacterium PBB3]
MKSKDVKILWGRSGNRCAICKTPLTQEATSPTASFTLGEQAHIVGDKENAARGKSLLTSEERDSYHNLILLCPNHHTEIDKNEVGWPVDKLHQVKSVHELWVTETLSETIDHVRLAQQTAISAVVDTAVELCDLENWQSWTSHALSPSQRWREDMPSALFNFRKRVNATIWPPEFDELSRAAISLSVLLHCASDEFMKHSDSLGNYYVADRFYRRPANNTDYDADLVEFEAWQDRCYDLVRQATKAANWFADVVRRDVNPMFFAAKGRFFIEEGPFEDLSVRVSIPQYTDAEKTALPASLKLYA